MEFTLIYRVETIDGAGFYHAIAEHDYAIREKFQMLDSHHPEPYNDGIESYEKHVFGKRFGFRTKNQLRQWFLPSGSYALKTVADSGTLYIAVYKVKDKDAVFHGGRQSTFDPKHAERVGELIPFNQKNLMNF